MLQCLKSVTRGAAGVSLTIALLSGCTEPAVTPPAAAPTRLADVVVTDPNFDFSTTQPVRLELTAAEGAAPQAVEVFDRDGRRLMDGAFRSGAALDLRVPVGKGDRVKLRVGTGNEAVERELTVDAQGRAVGTL